AVNIITILCSSFVAFGFFEQVSRLLAAYLGGDNSSLAPWLAAISFILLFIFPFAIFQTAASKLIHKSIEFNDILNRAGRCVCGAVYGFILTGLLLTVLAMMPLPKNLPYARINNLKPLRVNRSLLSPDDFVCGLFGLVSRGSMSSNNSFSLIHPSFISESYLNRIALSSKAATLTSEPALTVKGKDAVQAAPDNLKDKEGNPVTPSAGNSLVVVKAEISSKAGIFTLAQMRLICNEKSQISNPTQGRGINIYPLGYLTSDGRLDPRRLDETIQVSSGTRTYQLVFDMPNNYFPVFLAFKQNNIVRLPKISSPSDASGGMADSD
ncbi:MAG: CvpA family protein, partial [Phycisphaerae bacterium]